MQAIVEWLKGLLETLTSLNYERLFVGSVVAATLAGSLYVYLVDNPFAPGADQAQAVDPLVAERIAPIGRLTLVEPVVASSAVETAQTAAGPATGLSTGSSAEGVDSRMSASDAGSTEAAATSESSTQPAADPVAAADAVSAHPGEAQQAPASDRPITGDAALAEPPGPAQAYPPMPPGYMPMPRLMPMPAQGYAPVHRPYQVPPAAARQAPGAPSGFGPGPYRTYPPTLYERSVAPPTGYPPPQGWMR